MKPRRIYKISITDESRLVTLGSVSLSPAKALFCLAAGFLLILMLGYIFVLLTPVKTLIPGYIRESQRAASEQALLRVDSLREAYLRNEAYVANLNEVLNTERPPRPAPRAVQGPIEISADSLLPPSVHERNFVHMMQEREKFNVAVVAPMAAEGMLFYPVTDEGIVTHDSRSSRRARVALPAGAAPMAVADGVVLASYYDPKTHSSTMLLQHDNGFVSRYSGIGSPLVEQSEMVPGGQIISLPPPGKSGRPVEVIVELWHNGVPLIPYDYISSHHSYTSLNH